MTAFPDLAARLQAAFTPQATALSYRVVQNFTAKVTGGAAAGATSMTLGTLSSGFSGVQAGDTFVAGSYSFTATTAASGGSITAAPFTPALSAAMAAAAPVTIVRASDEACLGWVEMLDASSELSPQIKQGDARITVLSDSLSATPVIGARIVDSGKVWTITAIGRDPAGAAWVFLASG